MQALQQKEIHQLKEAPLSPVQKWICALFYEMEKCVFCKYVCDPTHALSYIMNPLDFFFKGKNYIWQ